ncbi:hypothetical protein FS837_012973 [Tulasnella sp. UAMH 9824]|nr:hypothetical protein FS837_012973 [Tulasnella sp. UAMH 9824]
MLSKSHRHISNADRLNLASRLRAFKSRSISRLFPLLSSLKYSKPKSQWTREFRVDQAEKDFVVLIFLSYKGWKRVTRSGELEDMELHAVRNDPQMLLDYLNYRHDDTSKDWYFLKDFDFEYKDWTGVTKALPSTMPSKNAILKIVREATRKGGSGFIHIGAHCMYDCHGTSHLTVQAGGAVYTEIPIGQSDGKAAYFVSSDGQRVYGKDLHPCLSDGPEGRHGTLTLLLDMCNAGAFLRDVVNLSCLNTTTPDATTEIEQTRSRKQLVLISSSQAGQVAGTLQNPAGYKGVFGAGTSLIMGYLSAHPSASPTELVGYLNTVCSKRPEVHLRQSPSIASRYPIEGALRLLPGPTAAL